MSIKVMDLVWEKSKQKGASLLVMLAIADHAHDDGGGAYPSTATLARKTRLTTRGIQRIIRDLVSSGELTVHLNGGPNRVNLYHVNIVTLNNIHPGSSDTRDPDIRDTDPDRNDGVPPTCHEQETVKEPSIEPPEEPSDIQAPMEIEVLPDWYADLYAIKGFKKSLPECQAWLDGKNISLDQANETAAAVKSKWPGPRTRPYTDAWATFRNWVQRKPLQQTNGRPTRGVPRTDPKDFKEF